MHRKRSKIVLLALAACCASAAAWMLAGPAAATVKSHASAKVTVVTVTLGKPSEFGIKLSKFSNLPAGVITFKVVNKGKAQHDFKVCAVPAKTTANNACNGKVTLLLNSGQTATLTVTIVKKGTYEYLCTVPGHAKIGMKGLMGVGVPVTATTGGTTTGGGQTTTTTTTTTTAGGGQNGPACATPSRATTVTVGMTEYAFQMSQTSIPCGTVTFIETNNGVLDHNINIMGATGGAGPIIHQGDTARFTVSLNPGTYNTQCDVPEHAVLGMVGQITVTA
jgi:nitrite reductase (NO-forming)